jgi:HNH endonuclease
MASRVRTAPSSDSANLFPSSCWFIDNSMTVSSELRAQIRAFYNYRCVYCGVSETNLGGELEIDHFHPSIHGGTDEVANLLSVCTTCNRFKGSYWPLPNAPIHLHLLHPGHDNLAEHIVESFDGQLAGLTQRGWFHIQWLHLNRPQLVELRQHRLRTRSLQGLLEDTQMINRQLRLRIVELEAEINRLQTLIKSLTVL